jgi:hypothetical protein
MERYRMKPKAATAEFDEMMGGYKSVDAALDKIASQVKFLNMVADHEYTAEDQDAILTACRNFYAVIRPMSSKYIDGE